MTTDGELHFITLQMNFGIWKNTFQFQIEIAMKKDIIFTSYEKALAFVEKEKEFFTANGKKLIYKVKKNAFQQVFAPFLAQQNLNYVINDIGEHFLDTFERLLAIMEADTDFIVDEVQKNYIEAGDFKNFYADACKKYLIFVG